MTRATIYPDIIDYELLLWCHKYQPVLASIQASLRLPTFLIYKCQYLIYQELLPIGHWERWDDILNIKIYKKYVWMS